MVGIGGAGMSGIARILLSRGGLVSGSDAKESRGVLALRARGAQVRSATTPTLLISFPAVPQLSSPRMPPSPRTTRNWSKQRVVGSL